MVDGMTNLTDHLHQTAEAERTERALDEARRLTSREEGITAAVQRVAMDHLISWGATNGHDVSLADVLGHEAVIDLDPEHRYVDFWLDGAIRLRLFPPSRGAPAGDWPGGAVVPMKLCPACGALVPMAPARGLWYAWQLLEVLEQPVKEHDTPEGVDRCDGETIWLKLPPEPKPRHRVALVLTPEAIEDTINELAAAGYWTPAGVTPTPEGTLIVSTYDPMMAGRVETVDYTAEEPF